MLKRIINKKLIITTMALSALLLICLVKNDNNYQLKDIPSTVSYVSKEINYEEIYLLNQRNLLSRTKIISSKHYTDIPNKAKFILESLIKDGPNQSILPNGFKAVIPIDTRIDSISYDSKILKVNFSKELLDISEDLEETMIEAIIYTATSIEGIDQVIIYVDNNILTLLPKSKTSLPSILNRSFGINKEFNFTKTNQINQVTIYYIDEFNGQNYYVPVTKYLNDDREKIKIIIDELTTTNSYNSNLMSFLNSNAEVLDVKQENDIMELVFNDYIFSDNEDKKILEEVIYTISLSIKDNYSVNQLVFMVDNKEIYKSVLKTIE